MAKNLSKSGISTGQDILAWHVTQSIDAFNASSSYDIAITGSLTVTGSIVAKDSVVNFESATSVSGSVFSGSTYYGDGSNLTNLPQTSLLSGSSNDLTASGDLSASGNITAFTYTASHGFNAQAHNDFEFSIVGENSFNMKHWTPNRDLYFLTHAGSGSINFGTNNTNSQLELHLGQITASGDISSSGKISAEHFYSSDDAEIVDTLTVGTISNVNTTYVTASADISSSGDLYVYNVTASGNLSCTNLVTSGSKVRRTRIVSISGYSTTPSLTVESDDDLIMVIDNTSGTPGGVGDFSFDISNFSYGVEATIGRQVEIIKIKRGSDTGIYLGIAASPGGTNAYNTATNTSINTGKIDSFCKTSGSAITLTYLGDRSCSIHGSGVFN